MRYIMEEDIDIVKTINMICNTPINKDKLCENLRQQYVKCKDDYKTAFAYGLLNFLLATKIKDTTIGSEKIEVIFNAFNDALELIPQYWLVQMFKAILLLELPEVMRNDKELEELLLQMIEQQKECEPKAYFIIPYIIYADFSYSAKGRDASYELLLEAEKDIPLYSLEQNYLKPYFCMPIRNFFKRLLRSGEAEYSDRVKKIGAILFPNEKVFQ
ncbi:hypothetical protein DW638_07090 [Tyzzerella nexilis]|nr:hypothetical protein DW638_07090 [[Clostridium] nexile]